MKNFDVIIIGTGTAGQTAALELAAEDYHVAIVENSDTPGGVCALRGCQAKKWFYEIAELVTRSQHLLGRGVSSLPEVDWQQILLEKNKFTSGVPESTIKNLEGNGITFIEGNATFVDRSSIRVNDKQFTADSFIVASGAVPRTLPMNGNEYMITSNDFLQLEDLPERIAFVGGGFISFEFAHFVARLGSRPGDIHILEAGERVLSPFDGDMVRQLVEASEAEGIQIHTHVSIISINKNDNGYTVVSESGKEVEVDLVVNGAGRSPNIEPLNLQAAGVDFSAKGIVVDRNMKTSNSSVFAVGDCVESLKLARVADMEAHVAVKTIIATKNSEVPPSIKYDATPAVLFTCPQLGMVGKTEEQLQEENIKYWKSYDTHLNWPTYRRVGLKNAAYKILVDKDNHLLGAHILSDNTTGLLNTFKQAMIDGTTMSELYKNNIMSPYPSRESDILYMLSPFID